MSKTLARNLSIEERDLDPILLVPIAKPTRLPCGDETRMGPPSVMPAAFTLNFMAAKGPSPCERTKFNPAKGKTVHLPKPAAESPDCSTNDNSIQIADPQFQAASMVIFIRFFALLITLETILMLYRILQTSRLSLLNQKSHLHLDDISGSGGIKNEPSSSAVSSIVASSRPRSQIFYQPSTGTTSSSSSWTRLPTSLTRTMSEQNKICLKDSNSDSIQLSDNSKTEHFNSNSSNAVSCSKGIVLLHLSKEKTFDPRKLDFSTLTLPKSN